MSEERGKLIVISGPSGVGKSTISHALIDRLGAVFSVSMTTRAKTAADTEGVDYFFVSPERFQEAVERGEMLEWAEVFGNCYGTPIEPVETQLQAGRHVLLEIDVNGAVQVRRNYPHALMIFILPPSEEELLNRLRRRAREDEETIQRRFREAQREIRQAKESGVYDHLIVNDDLDAAIEQAVELVRQRIEV